MDLIATVTILPFVDLNFLSHSLVQFSEVSLQRNFQRQRWDIYSAKRSESMCGVTHSETETSILTFNSWPWIPFSTWSSLILCDIGYTSDFWFSSHQDTSLTIACQSRKKVYVFLELLYLMSIDGSVLCLSQEERGIGECFGFRWCQNVYFRYAH